MATKQKSKQGYADVVIGLQYGDEGKARVVDVMANDYDIVARFNGGANAGHTIETKDGGKVALNQVPSAIFYPKKTLYIGSGCVVNIEKLAAEIQKLEAIKIKLKGRLHVSCLCSVVQPHQILLDAQIGKVIGTTKNGIGPCYADKAIRMNGKSLVNIRLGDLLENPKKYFANILENLKAYEEFQKVRVENPDNYVKNIEKAFAKIKDYIQLDTLFMEKQAAKGARILFEGAQSVMLDINKGSVPYVTSSNTVAGAAFVGGDLSANYHRKTIGIAKAIMSRVGNGPFTSEFGGKKSEEYCAATLDGGAPKYAKAVELKYDIKKLLKSKDGFDVGKAIRVMSAEYGTVTTRPRRVGMFDLVQLNYAIRMNGVSELIINKCDLLNVYAGTAEGKIPLVVGYKLDGKKIDYVPGAVDAYERVKPVIVKKTAFKEDVSKVRQFSKLPAALREVAKLIEKSANCKIVGMGVGAERTQYVSIK
ncbi:MAG: adenylosuccinate synthetase [Patescibacteria group bacterium]